MPHAAEITFAFLTHISNQYKGQCMRNFCRLQRMGDRQQCRDASAVVGDPRPEQASSLLADIQRRFAAGNTVSR